LHLVGILFPHINDDALLKSHQINICLFVTPEASSYWSTARTWRLCNHDAQNTKFDFEVLLAGQPPGFSRRAVTGYKH